MDSWLALDLEDERCQYARSRQIWTAAHTEILTGAREARTAPGHLNGHRATRDRGIDEPQAHGRADLESSGARTGGGGGGGAGRWQTAAVSALHR
jgi:hypothetical protein